MISVWVLVCAAFGLWYFAFQTDLWNFWVRLSLAAAILAVSALTSDRRLAFSVRPRDVWLGVASALGLYALFWLGKQISLALLPFAEGQISAVYANRSSLDLVWIGLLLFFLLGPGEEIFWRGFVQRRLSEHFPPTIGWLTTTALYAFVHIWTLNLILIAAAAVAGLFWGWLYQRERSLMTVMISHALWDVMIFVLFPLWGA